MKERGWRGKGRGRGEVERKVGEGEKEKKRVRGRNKIPSLRPHGGIHKFHDFIIDRIQVPIGIEGCPVPKNKGVWGGCKIYAAIPPIIILVREG